MNQQLLDPIESVRYRPSLVSRVEVSLKQWVRDRGWTCDVWQDPPGAYHSPHDHPYSHRVLLESGGMVFTVDGETYEMEPGDGLDLPRNVTHEARAGSDRPARYWLLRDGNP